MSGPVVQAHESFPDGAELPATIEVLAHLSEFLRWRFSLLPPGAFQYLDSETDTEIVIGGDTPIDPVKIGHRPAITLLRSQAAFQGTGIGDLAFVDLQTGAHAFMDLIPTTVMINVLSQLPYVSERLAWFCAKQIRAFRIEIVKRMPELLYLGSRIGISAPSPAGSLVNSVEFEWSVTVLSLPVYLQTAEHILPLNKPILGGVTINATAGPKPALVDPVLPLQGTAVMQPKIVPGPADSSGELPQTGADEAQSSEPLTVTIKT